MAHNIYGDRFIGTAPAWHGIMRGPAFKNGDRLSQVIESRGMGVVIDKRPIGAMMDDGSFMPILDRNGAVKEFALYRRPTIDDPHYVNLGIVSAAYSYLHDGQFADLVDRYLDRTGWHLESFGYLGDGETIWAGMRGNEFTIAKEDYRHFFHAIEHRDGKRNGVLLDTPVCIVCENTMAAAMKHYRAKVAVRHTADYVAEMSWRMEMISDAVKHGESIVNVLRSLHKIALDEKRFSTVIDNVLELPKPPASLDMLTSNVLELRTKAEKAEKVYVRDRDNVLEMRDRVKVHFEYVNDTRPTIAGTALAGAQAFTGWLDHDRNKKNTANQARVRSEESVFGDGPVIRGKVYAELLSIR